MLEIIKTKSMIMVMIMIFTVSIIAGLDSKKADTFSKKDVDSQIIDLYK